MKSLVRLTIPLVLAIAAAVGNQMYLSKKLATESYVAVSKPFRAGDGKRITKDDLAKIDAHVADGGVLKAVKWGDRAILIGAPVRRDFEAGELVLLSDIRLGKSDLRLQDGEVALVISLSGVDVEPSLLRVGRDVGFVVHSQETDEGIGSGMKSSTLPQVELGPFRLISVGDDTETETVSDDGTRRAKVMTISVATSLDDDHVLADMARRLVNAAKYKQILAVTLRRFQDPGSPVGQGTD